MHFVQIVLWIIHLVHGMWIILRPLTLFGYIPLKYRRLARFEFRGLPWTKHRPTIMLQLLSAWCRSDVPYERQPLFSNKHASSANICFTPLQVAVQTAPVASLVWVAPRVHKCHVNAGTNCSGFPNVFLLLVIQQQELGLIKINTIEEDRLKNIR